MFKKTVVPVLLASLAWGYAAADEQRPSYWERKEEGWFFYNEKWRKDPADLKTAPPPSTKPETVTEATPPPVSATPAPASSAPANKGPEPLSSAWFRENLPKYRDAAWDNPTIENVRAFMYLQRYAMDRSLQFADVTQLAVVGDPWLDESVRRPTASFASHDLDRQAGNARNQLLSALAERVGIFFFYSSDCAMCEAQVPIMKMAQRDFKVVPISLDGKDLPSAPFPDVKADSGHAEMLGVEQLPAIYLASPDGQFAPIAQGAIALNEMRERMIIAARKAGWVTEEEFNKTRPILNLEENLSEVLPIDALGSAASEGETNFIPPAELLNIINHTTQGN